MPDSVTLSDGDVLTSTRWNNLRKDAVRKWDISGFFKKTQDHFTAFPWFESTGGFTSTGIAIGVQDFVLNAQLKSTEWNPATVDTILTAFYMAQGGLAAVTARLDAYCGVNRCAGVTPTVTSMTVDSGANSDVTDEIIGEGVRYDFNATADNTDYITLDMGASYSGYLVIKGMAATTVAGARTITIRVKTSSDGVSYGIEQTFTIAVNNTKIYWSAALNITSKRYIRVTAMVDSGGVTTYMEIGEIAFFDTSQSNTGQYQGAETFLLGTDGLRRAKLGASIPQGDYILLVVHLGAALTGIVTSEPTTYIHALGTL